MSRKGRNGAILISAAMAVSTITSCGTNKPNDFGRATGEAVAVVYIAQLEKDYGKTFDEIFEKNPYGSDRFIFSREKLGRTGQDGYEEYPIEETTDEFSGPISLKISFVNGQLRVKDTSRDGMDEETKQWILERIAGRKEFLIAAGKAGSFSAVNVRLNATDVRYVMDGVDAVSTMTGDATLENELNIVFPRGSFGLSASIFDQMLVHEISHLLGSVISEDFLKHGEYSREAGRLLDVCAAIRKKAIDQLDPYLYGVVRPLDSAIQMAENPKLKTSMGKLLDVYVNRQFPEYLPDSDPYFVEVQDPQFGSRAAFCANNSLSRQLGMVETELDLKLTDEEFSAYYQSETATRFFEADDELRTLLQEFTIYRYLAESQYDPNNNFGHGYDNLNEQFASAIALLINPQGTGYRLAYADEDQRALVVEFIEASSDLLAKRFPQIAPVVRSCTTDFHSALNLETVSTSKGCLPGFER